ncbi:MAG: hypothetical protein KGO96_13950 [Elusimicrobia bacterium]|nr:hypothetical protein [Elusimicrobiota bacterium]
MIHASPLPGGPLELPAVAVWRIDAGGHIAGIDSAWETPEGVRVEQSVDIPAWLTLVKAAHKATAPRSAERFSLTHWLLPGGQDGWLALLAAGIESLPGWRVRRVGDAIASATVALTSRITLQLGSAEALTGTDWSQYGEMVTPGKLLAQLRRMLEWAGVSGRCPMSLSGIACSFFRATLKWPIVTPQYPKHLDFQQEAVQPGRITADPGSWPQGHQYDRNGAYVAAMRDVRVPTSPRGAWTSVYEGEGIYRGEFTQPEGLPPLLRDAESREFRYQGTGTFCSNEIDALLAVGGEFTVHEGYRFLRLARLLAPFAAACWELRERAPDPFCRDLAKGLPLRLYGVLLSQGKREYLVPHTRDLELGTFKLLTADIAILEEQADTPWRFPAIGAFVLAEQRVSTWRAMCAAQAAGGRTVATYVDAVTVIGAELPTGNGLGEWKETGAGRVDVLDPQRVRVGKWARAGGIPKQQALAALAAAGRGEAYGVSWRSSATLLEVLVDGIAAGAQVERQTTVVRRLTPLEALMLSRKGRPEYRPGEGMGGTLPPNDDDYTPSRTRDRVKRAAREAERESLREAADD